jgi:hypothetical protein
MRMINAIHAVSPASIDAGGKFLEAVVVEFDRELGVVEECGEDAWELRDAPSDVEFAVDFDAVGVKELDNLLASIIGSIEDTSPMPNFTSTRIKNDSIAVGVQHALNVGEVEQFLIFNHTCSPLQELLNVSVAQRPVHGTVLVVFSPPTQSARRPPPSP